MANCNLKGARCTVPLDEQELIHEETQEHSPFAIEGKPIEAQGKQE